MIRWLATTLARALLESAVILLAVAAVLMVASYRLGRRVITTSPDRLEGISGKALQLAALIPRRPPAPLDEDVSPAGGTEA